MKSFHLRQRVMQTGVIKLTRFRDNQGIRHTKLPHEIIIALRSFIKIAQAYVMIFEICNLIVEMLRNTVTMARHLFYRPRTYNFTLTSSCVTTLHRPYSLFLQWLQAIWNQNYRCLNHKLRESMEIAMNFSNTRLYVMSVTNNNSIVNLYSVELNRVQTIETESWVRYFGFFLLTSTTEQRKQLYL